MKKVKALLMAGSVALACAGTVALAQAPAAPSKPGAVATGVVVAAAPGTPEQRMIVLRRKVLRDDDFVESDSNRDPFRSFMSLFETKAAPTSRAMPAIFDKFALEELSLIAVVSGTERPMAMFRDPGGMGQVIKRGDYLSKSGARVTKILGDRVILELNEVAGTGEARAIEKAILVNPEAAQQ